MSKNTLEINRNSLYGNGECKAVGKDRQIDVGASEGWWSEGLAPEEARDTSHRGVRLDS